MKQEAQATIIRYATFIGFFIFLVLGVLSFEKDPDFVFDKFLTAAILLVFYFLHRKMHLTLFEASIGAFALILHHLKLYGNVYLGGIEFDLIMHFIGGYAISLVLFQALFGGNYLLSHRRIAVFALLAAIGMGTFVEILEFIGYSYLGKGEGILFYGTGDIGEWNDAAWDLIMNVSGAVLGIVTMLVLTWNSHKSGPPKKK